MYKQGFIPVRTETKRILDRMRRNETISFDALLLKMIHLYDPAQYPGFVEVRSPAGWSEK